MTYTSNFDDFLSSEKSLETIDQPPFQFRDDKSEKGTLKWLITEFDNNEAATHSRMITYRRYQSLYKNIQWKYFDSRDSRRENEGGQNKRPRHSVNFVHEMVESRVSQNARMRHHLAFVPSHDEQSDVNNAKLCKLQYDGYADENDLESKHVEQDRVTFKFGHSFHFVEWDEYCGPLDERFKMLQQVNPKLAKKEFKGKNVHIGDVKTDILGPDRVNVERNKKKWKDMDWVERIDFIQKEKVQADYPKCKNLISDNQRNIYDFDSGELTKPSRTVVVRTFYHRPTRYLPEGAKIVYCDDCILSWESFPYNHGMLPCVPDTDIDVYGEFWGRSFIMNIEQMQRFYNAMQSAQARDFSWASAPKWLVPARSCNIHNLDNDISVLEYKGAQAPQLSTPRYTPPQTMELQDRIEKKIGQQSRVYGISRGEVPPGVTANSALRFLDEQESQVVFTQEQKRKRRVVKVAKLILETMKQFYKPEDGRMVRMIGAKNEYLIKSTKGADFTRVYDVKIQNTSALPDTKSGRIGAIVDLNATTQDDPVFKREEIVQMLDLGNDDYFKDRATVAVDAANTAFDELLNGEDVAPPTAGCELMIHYSVFSKGIQSFAYQQKTDEEVKDRIELYMKTLEMLMFERARVNMKFCAQLMENDQYPMFFKPSMPVGIMMGMHTRAVQGAQQPEQPITEGAQTQNVEKIPAMNRDESNIQE